MVTAAVASAFRVQRDLGEMELERRLQLVNQEVLRVANGEYLMALTAITIDQSTNVLTAYSAGGCPPVMISDARPAEVVTCRGTPLGTVAFTVGVTRRFLQPSTRIFVSTDGVLECEVTKGRRFGLRRIIGLLEKTSALDVEEAVSVLSQEVTAANGSALQTDDWTFMVADWRAAHHSRWS
jgi:serine phosphatase RsbU (regulator of sigma subunit)